MVDTTHIATSEDRQEDRPTSPWTPSWSVTTQGNAGSDLAELDELEQLPPVDHVAPISEEPEIDAQGSLDEPKTVPTIDIIANEEHTDATSTDVIEGPIVPIVSCNGKISYRYLTAFF